MKYLTLTFLAYLMTVSASSLAQQAIADNTSKQEWLILYKQFATYKCICEITNNRIEKVAVKTKDYSFVVNEEVLGGFADHADSVGRAYAKKIPMIRQFKKEKLYGYRLLLLSCLRLQDSKYIDSIAEKEYRQHIKLAAEGIKTIDN